jgi:hypothetical protein
MQLPKADMWEEVSTEYFDKALELGKWAAIPLPAPFWLTFPAIGQLSVWASQSQVNIQPGDQWERHLGWYAL